MRESVKIISCALHEDEDGSIILRGVIAPDSLGLLETDDYQREIMPQSKIQDLIGALNSGGVPDVVLGMRGHRIRETNGAYYLQDPVYIIDGLQRISAGRLLQKQGGEPTIGAMIHFGTNKAWERERFQVLNSRQTKLSPNVFIRNMHETHPAIGVLYALAQNDDSFVLNRRISWTQRMRRGSDPDLITARTYIRVVGRLHADVGPGRHTNIEHLANGLGKIMKKVGRNVFRDNIKTFFDVIDQCWGVRAVMYTDPAAWLKANFLETLALLFSNHENFWRGHRLKVDRDYVHKIKKFSIRDPSIVQLAGSGNAGAALLYELLLKHINSGKRTRRLRGRHSNNGVSEVQPTI